VLSVSKHKVMPKHKKDKRTKSVSKPFSSESAAHPTVVGVQQPSGEGGKPASQQHDSANRLGGFAGAGNHARTANPGHQ
jgi:hypothetical protein